MSVFTSFRETSKRRSSTPCIISPRLRSLHAFTLLEMLVYIVLLGIIMNLVAMGFFRSWQITKQSVMHLTNLASAQNALGRAKEEIRQANTILPSFGDLINADDTLLLRMKDSGVHAFHFDGRRLTREVFLDGESVGKISLGRFENVRFSVDRRLVKITVTPIRGRKPGKFQPVFDCAVSLRSRMSTNE